MMKYLILLFTYASFSQTDQALQTQAAKLYDAIYNMDIEGILNMSCLANDAVNYDRLDKAFQNDEFKLRFSLTNAKYNVSDAKTIEGKTWNLLTYRNVLRITYFKKLNASQITEIQQMYKSKFSAQSVTYEKNRNSFLLIFQAKYLAYRDGGNLKMFVADDTLLTDMFKDCIPKEVRKEFNLNQ